MLLDVFKHNDRADKVHDRESRSESTRNCESISEYDWPQRSLRDDWPMAMQVSAYIRPNQKGPDQYLGYLQQSTPLLLPLGTADILERAITLHPCICHAMWVVVYVLRSIIRPIAARVPFSVFPMTTVQGEVMPNLLAVCSDILFR